MASTLKVGAHTTETIILLKYMPLVIDKIKAARLAEVNMLVDDAIIELRRRK